MLAAPYSKILISVVAIMVLILVVWALKFNRNTPIERSAPSAESIARADTMFAGTLIKNGFDMALPYRLYIPKNYDKSKTYPLVLFLHGWGSDGEDNVRQVTPDLIQFTAEAQEREPTFILAPQMPSGQKWVEIKGGVPFLNYRQDKIPENEGLKLTKLLIHELMGDYPVDSDRIYVTGFSAGAAGVWDIISRGEERLFAAAIAISGAFDPSAAKEIATMPIWLFHGSDDVVSPSSNMMKAVDALKQFNSPVKYREIKGVGHGSQEAAYGEEGLKDWLFSQRLSSWYNKKK